MKSQAKKLVSYGSPKAGDSKRTFLSRREAIPACVVLRTLGVTYPCRAWFPEKPAVKMGESTAATHLLSKQEPQRPREASLLSHIERVVLLVTVNRQGAICDLDPVWGLSELRKAALKTPQTRWHYRPFLVDRNLVVAKFPVTVTFIPREAQAQWVACWRTRTAAPAVKRDWL